VFFNDVKLLFAVSAESRILKILGAVGQIRSKKLTFCLQFSKQSTTYGAIILYSINYHQFKFFSVNPTAFFFRIQLTLYTKTNESDKIYDGQLNWVPQDYEIYQFTEANCALKSGTNDMDNIECTCCEKYAAGDVDTCKPVWEEWLFIGKDN
jgi:hypothetical protein